MQKTLPAIPAKRYFTIGEVADLCGVKPHVLRYWEQEFSQLRPMKRRGNRRYYQRHEVLMIRRIRELLYDQGFTISGARNKLLELAQTDRSRLSPTPALGADTDADDTPDTDSTDAAHDTPASPEAERGGDGALSALSAELTDPQSLLFLADVRRELVEIRALLLQQFSF